MKSKFAEQLAGSEKRAQIMKGRGTSLVVLSNPEADEDSGTFCGTVLVADKKLCVGMYREDWIGSNFDRVYGTVEVEDLK